MKKPYKHILSAFLAAVIGSSLQNSFISQYINIPELVIYIVIGFSISLLYSEVF